MKSPIRSAFSAVLLGSVIAAAVILNVRDSRKLPQLQQQAQATVRAAEQTLEASGRKLAAAAVDLFSKKSPAPVVQQQKSGKTALLAESVIILGGVQSGNRELPKGTQVALLQRNGDYLQIRHQDRILTIPSSALTRGAYRTF